jgi:hypothetical protein
VLAALTDDKVRGPREPAARQPIPRSSSRRTATRPLRRGESAPTARSGTTASHTRSMLTRSSESGAVWIPANDRAYAAGCAPRDPAVRPTAGAPRDPGATATTRPDRRERAMVAPDGPRRSGGRRAGGDLRAPGTAG